MLPNTFSTCCFQHICFHRRSSLVDYPQYYIINISRTNCLPITMKYFVNQEKYSYWILLHTSVALCIKITATIEIRTTFIAYLQHTCMECLKLSRIRINTTMKIWPINVILLLKKKNILKPNIMLYNKHNYNIHISFTYFLTIISNTH